MMKNKYVPILEYLKKEKLFDFGAYQVGMLERRIENRMMKTGIKTLENYLFYLQNNLDEPALLIDNFRIHVSEFFRDSLCFEILSKEILEKIIFEKQQKEDKSLRVWSAGCSYGEEAYSLAMLLNELKLKEKTAINIQIFATDVDKEAVRIAGLGAYANESMYNVKVGLFKKYFTEKDGKHFIVPEIKKMVQFSVYDLLDSHSYAPSESVFGDFDLILCRNVLIYFKLEHQTHIFSKLYKSLKTNGILMLGEAETPINHYVNKFKNISNNCKIFKKIQ
ncbi:protein-glutamate O-methyltransferase CheR [Lutibacter sp.]|uniref:CheR family methyltransferase n=1 Tax=Lutibacter sp. TaxID=1925666 RepID=UPI001A3394A8|nr:protein-glutamate O-methyltransferase CheR [Lutibacter sp.]MBI9040237.1 protein-glutamate O-methyltransferase CheR [Lutibacter sp.]